jgi:hypothetical protein
MTYRVRWTLMKDSVELSSELMDARFREREEAAAYIVTLQIKYQNRGYDRAQDKWWGKQDDEAETRIWSVEADADDQMIADVFKERPASSDDTSGWQEAKSAPQKGYRVGLRALETDTVAREIIGADKAKRDAKTARLKAQREAADATPPPKPAKKPKKGKR